MKKLIAIALTLTLALAMVLVPSVAASAPGHPIVIHKNIPPGGPIEDFTFKGWRDLNNNGVVDDGDQYLESINITGNGSGTLYSRFLGVCIIIHEVLGPDSAYIPQPAQTVQPGCYEITFNNQLKETGQIKILKQDGAGNALAGATFQISPNPKTGVLLALTVVDEGLNDEASGQPGVLLVSGCRVCLAVNVTETVAPPGYDLDPTPQTAHVTEGGETVTLTFVNVPKKETGQIKILKTDGAGNALAGATFEISPNPKTGEPPALTVVDGGLNDEAPGQPGVLLVSGCLVCVNVTVTETVAPPGYTAAPPQNAHVTTAGQTVELTFVNKKEERGELVIRKVDKCGRLLGGAHFLIQPNPKTGTGSLLVVDNGANDENPTAGILLVTNCLKGITCTVTETVAPPGYVPAPSQQVTIACKPDLKFVNYPTCHWWGGWWSWKSWWSRWWRGWR